ncbi:MAG TPA: GPP34 family phosphoprotein [Mycobacterium sp.]|uniref:GOLPH3/VPS74 family protein n=1 Tax=Mycobacterium sp. TaxID=1785 RepID=UPI002D36063C|nr:GPP34 family phosphoprotein [Mycobacterium sp.]HZU45972.1 GPP34 family phosphoprotein [Mycobacterium sp.]
MAKIAEDLLLLLLDNAAGQPALDRARLGRVLAAAVLLDLAHACRIRPAVDGEPVQEGRLLVLTGPDPGDPVVAPALQLLLRRPLSPAAAIAKLRRDTPAALLSQLERSGQVHRVRLYFNGSKPADGWQLTDRSRASQVRAAMTAALFDQQRPDPTTATIISLLHAVNGLGAIFSLDHRGWEWVLDRAGDIASGSWVSESEPDLPEVNLAVTTAAIRHALA